MISFPGVYQQRNCRLRWLEAFASSYAGKVAKRGADGAGAWACAAMSDYRDRIYGEYLRGMGQDTPLNLKQLAPRAPALERTIRKFFPTQRDARILDLGCGHGALIHFARKAGFSNVSGVDVSAEQVATAFALGIQGVAQGDLLTTLRALPAESHDVVVAFDVVEHFTKDELIRFVGEVQRVLKKGGRWIIHAPNGASPFVGAIRYGDFTHEQAFTPNSLLQLLRSCGFSHAEFFESGPVAASFKGAVRVVLWQGIRMLLRFLNAVETGDRGRNAVLTRNMTAVAYK